MEMKSALSMIGTGTPCQYSPALQMKPMAEFFQAMADVLIQSPGKRHVGTVGLIMNDGFERIIDHLQRGLGALFFRDGREQFGHEQFERRDFRSDFVRVLGIFHAFCSVGWKSMGQIIRSGVLSARPDIGQQYRDSIYQRPLPLRAAE